MPQTTRIGGGLSARTALVGVLVALVAIGWLGVSGRPSVENDSLLPAPSATPPDIAVVSPTPAATATPRRPLFQADVPLAGEEYHREMMQSDDAYALLGRWDERFYLAFLAEPTPGRMFGEARMPPSRRPTTATFELLHLWTREPASALEVLETWTVPMPRRGEPGTHTLLLRASRPGDTGVDAPRLLRDGYEVTVVIEWREHQAFLRAEVHTASLRLPPPPGCAPGLEAIRPDC